MLSAILFVVLSADPITVANLNGEWVVAETRQVAHVVERKDAKLTWCYRIVQTPNGRVQGADLVEVLPLKGGNYGIVTDVPGDYRFMSIDSKFVQTVEDFTIGKPPTPPPTPIDGKRNVIILHETADTKPAFAKFLVDIRTSPKENHSLFIFDKDTKDPRGQTPDWLKGWLAKTTTFPVIFISDEKGTPLYQGPVPSTVQEYTALLEKY